MSDIADKADKEIETNLLLALALQHRRGTVTPPEGWDGKTCVDCEDEITPPGRVALGCVTCFECQQLREKPGRH
jgi:RNA polymerase-binding transcription factor DksA